jgi:hypothetical protein
VEVVELDTVSIVALAAALAVALVDIFLLLHELSRLERPVLFLLLEVLVVLVEVLMGLLEMVEALVEALVEMVEFLFIFIQPLLTAERLL